MTSDENHERLTPYQEAIRLSISIELGSAIDSAYLAMRRNPDGGLSRALHLKTRSAYQHAVSILMQVKVPLSDEMIHSSLEYLRELAREDETNTDRAA